MVILLDELERKRREILCVVVLDVPVTWKPGERRDGKDKIRRARLASIRAGCVSSKVHVFVFICIYVVLLLPLPRLGKFDQKFTRPTPVYTTPVYYCTLLYITISHISLCLTLRRKLGRNSGAPPNPCCADSRVREVKLIPERVETSDLRIKRAWDAPAGPTLSPSDDAD